MTGMTQHMPERDLAGILPDCPVSTSRGLVWVKSWLMNPLSLSEAHTLQIDLPRDWANLALYRDVWRGVVSRC